MTVSTLPQNAALARGLSTEQVTELSTIARVIKLQRGAAACRLGDEARDLFIVQSGIIELSIEAPVAGVTQRIVVEEASTGETLGWSALVPPHKYTLDAFAAVNCAVIALSRDDLVTTCRRVPALGTHLMHNLLRTVGRRLHVLQAMWIRELRRNLERDYPVDEADA